MIYIFRKEMKKWHFILWAVFFAMAGSTFWGYLSYKNTHPTQITVAKLNGHDIKLIDYQNSLNDIKMQINFYRSYAEKLGISVDMFLAMAGLLNPEKAAFDSCLTNKALDIEKNYFNIELDDDYFENELVKKIPETLKNSFGNIDMEAYKRYLANMNLTPNAFEKRLGESIEREFFESFLNTSNYITHNDAKHSFSNNIAKKSFDIIKFNYNDFLRKAKAQELKTEDISKYYREHKEDFRVPEKRAAKYWVIKSADYSKKIVVVESQIQYFYDRNKSSLFRIPPKVSVRHILFNVSKTDLPEKLETVLNTAKSVREKIVSKKANFSDMAKQYSQDKDTVSSGGLIGFIEKGKYDSEFERAAFRLQNAGDVSDIVKTDSGFELIQLDKRIPASFKALDSVRDEIVKTLKAKKALTNLRADLQRAVFNSQTNELSVFDFVKENNLKLQELLLRDKSKNSEKPLENILIEKIFARGKREKQFGFFINDDEFVLYQVTSIQKSLIPELKVVKNDVIEAVNNVNAKKVLKKELRSAKSSILSKSKIMKSLAGSLGMKFIETKSIKSNDKLDDLGLGLNFAQKAFILDSSDQILRYKDGVDYYLVQLKNMEQTSLISFENEKLGIIRDKLSKQKASYLQGFIASLLRTAKLEKYDRFLGNSRGVDYPVGI